MSPPAATLEAVDDVHAIQIPDPLTIEGIHARRAKLPKLKAGVAAPSDVEAFKGKGQHAHKPTASRWDRKQPQISLYSFSTLIYS